MSRRLLVLLCLSALAGCVTRPPTIAHVHIGHAITAVHVTPGHLGYVPLAAQRADEALTAARAAAHARDLAELQRNVAAVVIACDSPEEFPPIQGTTILKRDGYSDKPRRSQTRVSGAPTRGGGSPR